MGEIPQNSREINDDEQQRWGYEQWVELTTKLSRLKNAAASGDLEAQTSLAIVSGTIAAQISLLEERQIRRING